VLARDSTRKAPSASPGTRASAGPDGDSGDAWVLDIGRRRGALPGWACSSVVAPAVAGADDACRFGDRWEPGVFKRTPANRAAAAVAVRSRSGRAGRRRDQGACGPRGRHNAVDHDTVPTMTTGCHLWWWDWASGRARDPPGGFRTSTATSGSRPTARSTSRNRRAGPCPAPAGAWLDQGGYTGGRGPDEPTVRSPPCGNKSRGNRRGWSDPLQTRSGQLPAPRCGRRYWIFQFIRHGTLRRRGARLRTIVLIPTAGPALTGS